MIWICYRCQHEFDDYERSQGFHKTIMLDGEMSRICLPCVETVLREDVIKLRSFGE